MTKRNRRFLQVIGFVVLLVLAVLASQLSTIAAGLILHPFHRRVVSLPPAMCRVVTLKGEGVTLQGWSGEATGRFRGTLVYLHGVADNRTSGAGVMQRFQKRGFDVVAYDSRAHGESGDDACTYGYFEKEDLRRVLNVVRPGPVVLVGSSLGAAVALQLAADEPRIVAVVAAESFSDLRTAATERAPFFFTSGVIGKAFTLAEQEGRFRIDTASPVAAAKAIKAPVLLVHGAEDVETGPEHARRIFAALAGPKRLILVPGAGHNQSLHGDVWSEIESWIDSVVTP